MSSLFASELTFRYRGGPTVLDLTWELSGPAVIGLLGPNGAGKTTLMKLLATALSPISGRVIFAGEDLVDKANLLGYRRRLGFVPQEEALWESFTALESVKYVGWLRQVQESDIRDASLDALTQLGVADLGDRKIRELSGGQRRRVQIAQGLVNRPDVLLLDEPTAGLDPEQRLEFRDVMRSAGEHALVIIATHLIEDVVAACDRVAVITEGKLVFEGSTAQLESVGRATQSRTGSLAEDGYLAVLGEGGARCAPWM